MPHLPINPIHLGRVGHACVEPEITGMQWYADYTARHAVDGTDGRLISQHSFDAPWDMWEMHPAGAEVVICTTGQLILHQEHPDGGVDTIILAPGDYAINPPGVWHTADVPQGEATAIFITSGLGTEHRPR